VVKFEEDGEKFYINKDDKMVKGNDIKGEYEIDN
jgi:hypothetical protein